MPITTATRPATRMRDVGLTSGSEPLSGEYRLFIKYTVEVDGLPAYIETYDVENVEMGLTG